MNNKPVAWMELYYGEPNNIAWTDAELRDSGEVYKTVPLYTHPAKTLTEIIEKNKPEIEKVNAYIKSLEDEIKALKAKTLTDEEINRLWAESHEDGIAIQQGFTTQQHYFAHLILRKAQEK
jgi:hypothetical protein